MNDKIIHFIASIMLVAFLSIFFHYAVAMIIALAIGICKELYDKYIKRTYFDWADFAADAAGCIIGMYFGSLV